MAKDLNDKYFLSITWQKDHKKLRFIDHYLQQLQKKSAGKIYLASCY